MYKGLGSYFFNPPIHIGKSTLLGQFPRTTIYVCISMNTISTLVVCQWAYIFSITRKGGLQLETACNRSGLILEIIRYI